MTSNQLFLFNKSPSQIICNLAKYRPAKATTLRQNATVPVSVLVPPKGRIDLVRYLDVTKEEAMDVLERSDEVQYFAQPGGPLLIIDPDTVKPATTEEEQNEIARENERREAAKAKAVEEARKAREEAEQDQKIHRIIDEPVQTEDEAEQAAQDKALESTLDLQGMVTGALPSTRWSRQELLDYADKHNIDVGEAKSKNAILRELRRATAR